MTAGSVARPTGKGLNITLWILQGLLAALYLFFGATALVGSPQVTETMNKIGWGSWFQYFTGIWEITGGILLLIPRLAFFGALLLAIAMVVAIYLHLTTIGGTFVPALVCLVLELTVAWFRRPRGVA